MRPGVIVRLDEMGVATIRFYVIGAFALAPGAIVFLYLYRSREGVLFQINRQTGL